MTESVWSDRTLAAASALTARRPSIEMRELDVITEVAVMFADRFDPADRDYPVTDDSPRWHREVREALADLRAQGLVDADGAPPRPAWPGPRPHRSLRVGRRRPAPRRRSLPRSRCSCPG